MTKLLSNEEVAIKTGWTKDTRYEVTTWLAPDSEVYDCIPDFRHDLNAQAKWLWPYVYENEYSIMINSTKDKTWATIFYSLFDTIALGQDKDPATAFIKAFSKLERG